MLSSRQSAFDTLVPTAAAGLALGALLAPPSVSAQDDACVASGPLQYLCGPINAEDLVRLGDTGWLIASGMSTDDAGPAGGGHLYLVDRATRSYTTWFPTAAARFEQDDALFPDCPGPLDVENFSAHGLALKARGPGHYALYVTSHGAREAVEVFEIDATGTLPTLVWRGCVELPERTSSNSVAILSDGGFVATKMLDPTDPAGFNAVLAGKITGNVYEWHPGGEVFPVAGTELSGANGIELSRDERWMFVAAIGSSDVIRFDRAADPVTSESVRLGIRPDNLRWTEDGTLFTVGGNVAPEQCSDPPCATGWSVYEVDPDTLTATRVAGADGTVPLQGASTALAVGSEIWIGTFRGDRIGYLPRP